MKLQWKKVIAVGVTTALCVSGVALPTTEASAAKAKKVTLNKKKVVLYKGADKSKSSFELKATVKPKSAAKVSFKSANKKIATVSKKGLVKAKKAGSTKIVATVGNKQAVCKVTVKKIVKKVKKITVNKKSISLVVGKTAKIKTTISPKKATLKAVAFKSANKKIATVSSKGTIKAKKAGSTKITVSALDGSKKKVVVKVKVVKASDAKPTVAPTEEPKPTVEPTAEPTTEPSVAPTATPTAAPTTAPGTSGGTSGGSSGGGSTTPTPTAEPLTTPVEGKSDGEGNLEYALDGETPYLLKSTIAGIDFEVTSNDSTIQTLATVVSYLDTEKSIEKAYQTFEDKSLTNSTLKIAEDTAFTINKNAGSDKAKVTVSSAQSNMDGDYELTMNEENGTCYLEFAKNENNSTEANITKNTDGTYKISNIVCKQAGETKALTVFPAATTDLNVAVEGEKTTVAFGTADGNVAMVYDGENGVSIKIPEEYKEKYNINIYQ